MKRSIEKAIRTGAVTAALAAGIGQIATPEAVAAPRRQATIAGMARQVISAARHERVTKSADGTNLQFAKRMPHNNRATVRLSSSVARRGVPDWRHATYIDVDIEKPIKGNLRTLPVRDVMFSQVGNVWEAHSVEGLSHTKTEIVTENIDVTSGNLVHAYTETVTPGSTKSADIVNASGEAVAHEYFQQLENTGSDTLREVIGN